MSSSQATATRFAVSADGTRIAYEATGSGPGLIIVEGALCHRGMGAFEELAPLLADRFTVTGYDRRGRGESGRGTAPYSVQREVEDLVAVLATASPGAFVFGMSSGAVLSLEAARQGLVTGPLAVYEPPFILDGSHPPDDPGLIEELRHLIADGHRTRALKRFMRLLDVPRPIVAVLPVLPMWKRLSAAADTLPHDIEIVSPYREGRPLADGHFAPVTARTLLMAGGKSPTHMQQAPVLIAHQIEGATTAVLAGQTHEVKAEVLAPVLVEFFCSG